MATFNINKGTAPAQTAEAYGVTLEKLQMIPGLRNLDPQQPVQDNLRFEIPDDILLGASLDLEVTRKKIQAKVDTSLSGTGSESAAGPRDIPVDTMQRIEGLFDQAESQSVLHRMSDSVMRFLQGSDPATASFSKSTAFKTLAGGGIASMLGVFIPGVVGQSMTAVGLASMLAIPGAAIAALALPLGITAWVYLRREKATEEVSREELQPMLDAFDGADAKERAIIGAQAALWLEELKNKGTLNPDAELALDDVVGKWNELDQGIRDQGLAWATISRYITRHGEMDFDDASALVSRLDVLTAEDQAAARQLVLNTFYLGSKPKVPMTDEAASFLFDAISNASTPEERLQGAVLELAFFRADTSHGGAALSEIEVDTLDARIRSFPNDAERKKVREVIRKVLFARSGKVKKGVEFTSTDDAKKMWNTLS